MQGILKFFEGIGTSVVSFFKLIISLVGDIVYLVQLTGRALSKIPALIAWLPGPVQALLVTAVTIAVLYKVLGRD